MISNAKMKNSLKIIAIIWFSENTHCVNETLVMPLSKAVSPINTETIPNLIQMFFFAKRICYYYPILHNTSLYDKILCEFPVIC